MFQVMPNMTPEQLRARVQEKLVTARTSLYNPLLQQPVRLEPVGPGSYPSGLGGYSYIGPPPDFGGSYGAYEDLAGRRQVGLMASKHHSMHDGAPMQLRSELTQEEREALLSQLDKAHEQHKCEHCRSELTISIAQPVEVSNLHCPYCGSAMSGAIDKAKACWAKLKENEMENAPEVKTVETAPVAVAVAPAAPVAAAPVAAAPAVAAPMVAAAEAAKTAQSEMGTQVKDVAKDAANAETPAQQHPHETPAKAAPMEHTDAAKVATEVKPMDEIAKGLTKAAVEAAAKKERLKAASDAWAKTRKERVASMRERHAAKVKASSEQATERAQSLKMRRELRILATFNPAKFAEVKKNEKLQAVCAEVEKKLYTAAERKQVRAELMSLAKENPEAFEQAKKELDFIAPEILMEEKNESPADEAAEKEGKKDEAAMDGSKEKKDEAPFLPAPAEAMKTEFLANLDELPGNKVEMSLYGEESENPFWNLTVDAEPVARIFLADQDNSVQIRSSFVSDAYAQNFGDLIGRAGLRKMLELSKAHVFAHRADDTEAAARIRDRVKAEVKAEFDAKIDTIQSDFLRAMELAMVASNKNLYEGEGSNALKGELFNAIVSAGLNEEGAVHVVESGFKAAPAYFRHLTEKAKEIMSHTAEAREQVEKWILGAGTKSVQTEAPADQDQELMARLVSSSASAIAMGGVVSGENRDQIRSHLGFSSTRR